MSPTRAPAPSPTVTLVWRKAAGNRVMTFPGIARRFIPENHRSAKLLGWTVEVVEPPAPKPPRKRRTA